MGKRIVIYITLLLALAGCVTIGNEFSAEAVTSIHTDMTTRDEIVVMFGEPWRIGVEDGKMTWTYAWYRYRPFNGLATQDLYIRFEKNGVVDYYVFNTSDKHYTPPSR